MEKGSGNGASVSMEALQGEQKGERSFTGNSESYIRQVKGGLENVASLSL
jgi:hypothetical protein